MENPKLESLHLTFHIFAFGLDEKQINYDFDEFVFTERMILSATLH